MWFGCSRGGVENGGSVKGFVCSIREFKFYFGLLIMILSRERIWLDLSFGIFILVYLLWNFFFGKEEG